MFKKLLYVLLLFAIVACKPGKEKIMNEIAEKEKQLINDSVYVPDSAKANEMLNLYSSFAEQYPDDSISADYLFKAGDIASKTSQVDKAISYYNMMYQKYPSHKNAPYALFLQGFILENQAGEPAKAKPYYEEFLRKYPDHVIAGDVAQSIVDLGKSPEELMRQFDSTATVEADTIR